MNSDLMTRFLGPLIRHGLNLVAGYLAAKGFTYDANFWTDLGTAATFAIGSLAWSYIEKAKAAKLVQVALALPPDTPLAVAKAQAGQ